MTEYTLHVTPTIWEQLRSKAEILNVPLDDLANTVLERYLEDEADDNTPVEDLIELYPECVVDGQFDYEKYSARIEDSLRRAMKDALAGKGRPAREVLEELEH